MIKQKIKLRKDRNCPYRVKLVEGEGEFTPRLE